MKFSQFKDQIRLNNNLSACVSYILAETFCNDESLRYIMIPRLNIVCSEDISKKLFLSITNEYKYHRNWLIKKISRFYISIVYLLLLTRMAKYLYSSINLEIGSTYPILIGGNNRYRLVNASNDIALVVSKSCFNDYYIENILRASNHAGLFSLNIMPKVMYFTDGMYFEEQLSGTAINRLNLTKKDSLRVELVLHDFFKLQDSIKYSLALSDYLELKIRSLVKCLNSDDALKIAKIKELFKIILRRLENKYQDRRINISQSHGDLNHGNIMLCGDKIYIIDWEFFDERYMLYDKIIFSNNLRHVHFNIFHEKVSKLFNCDFEVIIFLIEELIFRIQNYKIDVPNDAEHIELITRLIEERIYYE